MIATTDLMTTSAIPKMDRRYGRRGMPKHFVKKMYNDYLRLGSLAKVGALHGRTRQSVYDTLSRAGYRLNSRSLQADFVVHEGIRYSADPQGYLRATRRHAIEGCIYLHRRIWVAAHGPIPVRNEVTFRNGDRRDVRLENLELKPATVASRSGKVVGKNQHTNVRIEELIQEHMGFIHQTAWKWSQWSGCDIQDLVQEGRIAIGEADVRFDEARGFKFLTFARWYIEKRIRRFVQNHRDTIRIPVHLAGKVRIPTVSLDAPIGDDDHGSTVADLVGVCEDHAKGLADEETSDLLRRAMKRLPKPHQAVIKARFFDGLTLEEAGNRLGVTREAIRQREVKALTKLRRSILARRCR